MSFSLSVNKNVARFVLLCCCFFLDVWSHLSWSPESWLIKSTEAQTVKQKWCRIRAGHEIYMRLYVYLILFTVSCHFEDLAEVQGIVFLCMFLKCFFVMVCRSILEYWWLQYKYTLIFSKYHNLYTQCVLHDFKYTLSLCRGIFFHKAGQAVIKKTEQIERENKKKESRWASHSACHLACNF